MAEERSSHAHAIVTPEEQLEAGDRELEKNYLKPRTHGMNGWIGITDNEWFSFLSQQPGIDEVNFWLPD